MKIHVVETLNITEEQKKRLNKLGDVKWFEGLTGVEEFIKRCEGADIVALDWSPIDGAIPKMKPGVKLVSLPFTGYGFIPVKDAAKIGIKISNCPGFSTESVGEFGVALMIALVRKIYIYSRDEPKPDYTETLYGKTLGILGAGRIGSYVGKIASALGMKVIFFRRGDDLSKLLKSSDIVYCALPFTEQTKGMLGEKEFSMMKNGSFFVTTSHDLIYDRNALLRALDKNLAGFATDIEIASTGDYNSEYYKLFKNHPKILATPHVAWKTHYAQKRAYDMMIDNIEAFIKGKPTNIIN